LIRNDSPLGSCAPCRLSIPCPFSRQSSSAAGVAPAACCHRRRCRRQPRPPRTGSLPTSPPNGEAGLQQGKKIVLFAPPRADAPLGLGDPCRHPPRPGQAAPTRRTTADANRIKKNTKASGQLAGAEGVLVAVICPICYLLSAICYFWPLHMHTA
jgi:hypothetical protein